MINELFKHTKIPSTLRENLFILFFLQEKK